MIGLVLDYVHRNAFGDTAIKGLQIEMKQKKNQLKMTYGTNKDHTSWPHWHTLPGSHAAGIL